MRSNFILLLTLTLVNAAKEGDDCSDGNSEQCKKFALALTQTAKEGDRCSMPTGNPGQCKKFEKCLSALYDLRVNNKWPVPCGNKLFCCEDPEEKSGNPLHAAATADTDCAKTDKDDVDSTKTEKRDSDSGRISEKKCTEYSKWLDNPVLLPSAASEKIPGLCGIKVEPTIVGGEKAKDLEFPHMAKLKYSNPKHLCGASLISDQYLLTAAHCVKLSGQLQEPLAAELGLGNQRRRRTYKIFERIIHSNYSSDEKYNDIALLRLEEPLNFHNHMRPACLETRSNLKAKTATATGWGYQGETEEISNDLMKVDLNLNHNITRCSSVYRAVLSLQRGLDEKSMICAGGFDTNKDTCKGDSKGPLQIPENSSCMYRIVGITSFGVQCGPAPGVYTKVSNYVPWIESIVWPNA